MTMHSHQGCVGYFIGLLSGLLGLSAATSALGQSEATFEGLGDLPGGLVASKAFGVSADGFVVVGESYSTSGREAFRWMRGTGMMGLGDLPGGDFWSSASAVSGDGSVVVGSSDSGMGSESGLDREAFRWTQADGIVGLGDLPGGDFKSFAEDVSADGAVVVGGSFVTDRSLQGFIWTQAGGMVNLGNLPGGNFGSWAFGVSADGTVVVGQAVANGTQEAFRWTPNNGMGVLGDLPEGSSSRRSSAVSADGSVIVGRALPGPGFEGFRWSEASGMIGLGDLPGGISVSMALAVSGDGSRVVGFGNSAAGEAAFMWDAINGMQDLKSVLVDVFGLDLTGWRLLRATDISQDGRVIVGFGANPSGVSEAWVASIPGPACTADVDCDDGLACNGVETCLSSFCRVGTPVNCDDADVCTFDECAAATDACSNTPNTYGDVDHSQFVDINDLFCLLRGFAGEFNCSFADLDIEPCAGDGDIDLFDLLAILNAFSGIDPCCGGLP